MIKNRFVSFLVIIAVYVLAFFGGLFCYNYLSSLCRFSYLISLLIADVLATVIVFVFSLIFQNASVYDPYWSVQPPVILAVALFKCGGTRLGYCLFAAVLFWAIRTGAMSCSRKNQKSSIP